MKYSHLSAVTRARKAYKNDMSSACNRELPLSDKDLNDKHKLIKAEAMKIFHDCKKMDESSSVYEEQLIQVRTKHLQFPLNYWVFIHIGSSSTKIGVRFKDLRWPIFIQIFVSILFFQ